MNATRLLTVGAVVCLLAAGARAEDKPDTAKLIVGKWECTKADPEALPVGAIVEFTKDGKLKVTIKMGDQEMVLEGTYKLGKDSFDMVLKVGDNEHKETITIKKISDKELSTANKDGKIVELTKKK
jgi:uncharacterized protein (TIGR03066 family)